MAEEHGNQAAGEKPLKATLNLPQTAFAMKANLPQNEPARLAAWKNQDLYAQIREGPGRSGEVHSA